MNKKILSISALAGSVALFGLGCSSPSDMVKQQVEKKVSDSIASGLATAASDAGKVKIDTEHQTVQVKDDKTGNTMAYGNNVAMPDNFPKDVPVPANIKIVAASVQPGQRTAALGFTTTEDASVMAKFYSDSLLKAGWTSGTETKMSDQISAHEYTKGTAKISVLIIAANAGGAKSTQVTVSRVEGAQ